MKRTVLSLLLGCLLVVAQAQPSRGLKGVYIVDSFPQITFVWNNADPSLLDSSRFVLTEDDKPVNFRFAVPDIDDSVPLAKSVLILWEDMASHSRQSAFAATLLGRFFTETSFLPADRWQVAVFNRHKDSEPSLLKTLTPAFSPDVSRLAAAVAGYRPSAERFSTFPLESDLYLAVNEGIDMLRKEPADRAGVIIVVTAGLNVKAAGASTEMETVRKNARDAGIPVYVVNYPIAGHTPEAATLAESTFGASTSTTDVATALKNLQKQYRKFDKRLRGRDYSFTYTTAARRDGKSHSLCLTVDKVARPLPPLVVPAVTFGVWVKEHLPLFIGLVVLLIVLIVLAVMLVSKRRKEFEQSAVGRQQAAQQQMQQQLDEHLQQSAQREQQAIDRLRSEQAKNAMPKPTVYEKSESQRLMQVMQNKNLFPRLQCAVDGHTFTHTVNSPVTTIGRDAGNNVVLAHKTVSGHHAEIVFNGSAFEVVNISRSYTQGVIVNGQFYQRRTLASGDIIGLGEATVTFYL